MTSPTAHHHAADRPFVYREILTPVASYVGVAATAYAIWVVTSGQVSALWLLFSLAGIFALQMGISAGFHRLFCHSAFQTSLVWRVLLAWWGTLGIYGSTAQWCALHVSHHKHSDTDQDPHYTGWLYLLWKMNRDVPLHGRTFARLYREPLHRFTHRYYLLVVGTTTLCLYLVSPWLLLFAYLVPLGWLHVVNGFHQVLAHGRQGPRDLPLMELLLFTGGEWFHGHHHRSPRDLKFGFGDLGYYFIRLIETARPRGA